MKKMQGLGDMFVTQLQEHYTLVREDLGEDARLAKNGMAFETEAFRIPGVGHFCQMRMNAMLGLMKMETVVFAVTGKDVPLLNLDWVRAFRKETQIAELYDTQLAPFSEKALKEFDEIRRRDNDLPDVKATPHWYDAVLYPCSYHKAGKGLAERLATAAHDYTETFLRCLDDAPDCNAEKKEAKVKIFAERLFTEGGPAVNQVTKLFGQETAKRLIVRWMYGVSC